MIELNNKNELLWKEILKAAVSESGLLEKAKQKLKTLALVRNVKSGDFLMTVKHDGSKYIATLADVNDDIFESITGTDLNDLFWNIDERVSFICDRENTDHIPLTRTASTMKRIAI